MSTDLGRILAKHVDDAYLCETYNDVIQNLGPYDFESIEELIAPDLIEDVEDLGEEILPALSEILLSRQIPNWYAVGLLADIGGERAIEILLEVIRREVDLDSETSHLGVCAMTALWRISEGL
jgi:hypothetical protein